MKEGHTYPKLMTYFTEKFSTNFCNEVSYYTTILNYEGMYLSLSNNVAESYNAALNTFVLTVSKSTDINQILRRLRTHYLCSVREIKRQINVKMWKSDYTPCVIALKRFQKARAFTHKLSSMDQTINLRFLKKLTKMVDQFYEDI